MVLITSLLYHKQIEMFNFQNVSQFIVSENLNRSVGRQHALWSIWWGNLWGSPWGTIWKMRWSKTLRVLSSTCSILWDNYLAHSLYFVLLYHSLCLWLLFFPLSSIFQFTTFKKRYWKTLVTPRTWWGFVLRFRSEGTWISNKFLIQFSRGSKPIKFSKSCAWVSAE